MRKEPVGTSLTPSAMALVNDLVGTFLGTTRSEVVRFMILTWMADNSGAVVQVTEARRNTAKKAK